MPDDPTADALAQADAVVEDSVAQADAIVQDSVTRADAIVQDSVTRADAIVQDSVAQADAIVQDSVAQADAIVEDSVTRADRIVNDTVAAGDQTVNDTFTQGKPTPAGEDAGAPGEVEAASGGPPVASDEAVVAPRGGDASLTRFDGDPTSVGPPDVPLGAVPVAESPFAGPPDAVPVDAAPAPAVGDGSGLDAIVTTATDPAVMTATGVAVLVGGGLHIWRGVPQLPEAPILFTNVRLLPCLIRDSVADHVGAIAAALSRRSPETAVQIAVSPAIVPPQGVVAEAAALHPPAVAESAGGELLTRFGAPFREGFVTAVEGNREIGAAVADSRLMMQLGMAIGCVYAAFLTVWFWVTRVHRGGGA